MNSTYKYETPVWGTRLICFIYFVLSIVFLITFSTYEQWSGNSPTILKYSFLILSLVFLLISMQVKNWNGWLYFSANNEGLYFPSTPYPNKVQT